MPREQRTHPQLPGATVGWALVPVPGRRGLVGYCCLHQATSLVEACMRSVQVSPVALLGGDALRPIASQRTVKAAGVGASQ